MKTKVIYFSLMVLLLSACVSSKQKQILRDIESGEVFQSETLTPPPYLLQVGDRLNLRFNFLDEHNRELFSQFSGRNTTISSGLNSSLGTLNSFEIQENGSVQIPYVGFVELKGKTTRDAQKILEQRMREDLGDCSVRVTLSNNYYSIIGEAGVGQYSMNKEVMNMYEVLASSGTIKTFGDRKRVKVIRKVDGVNQIYTFDIRSKSFVNTPYFWVYPNDVIYVQPMEGQFFGIDSFAALFSIVSSVTAVTTLILKYVK